MVVVHRVDLREIDELLDLDCFRLLRLERLQLARLDHHVAVRRQLVALDDLRVRDLLAGRRVDALLRTRTPVLPDSWWKRTVLRSTALYIFTGTVTIPKPIVPVHIARGIRQ